MQLGLPTRSGPVCQDLVDVLNRLPFKATARSISRLPWWRRSPTSTQSEPVAQTLSPEITNETMQMLASFVISAREQLVLAGWM